MTDLELIAIINRTHWTPRCIPSKDLRHVVRSADNHWLVRLERFITRLRDAGYKASLAQDGIRAELLAELLTVLPASPRPNKGHRRQSEAEKPA